MMRASGATAVTVQMRMKRTSWSFFAETASSTNCAMMTSSRTVILRYRLSSDSTGAFFDSVYRNLTQQTEIAEHAAGAEHHRCQRIVGNRHRQAGSSPNAFIQILEQRAAAG